MTHSYCPGSRLKARCSSDLAASREHKERPWMRQTQVSVAFKLASEFADRSGRLFGVWTLPPPPQKKGKLITNLFWDSHSTWKVWIYSESLGTFLVIQIASEPFLQSSDIWWTTWYPERLGVPVYKSLGLGVLNGAHPGLSKSAMVGHGFWC